MLSAQGLIRVYSKSPLAIVQQSGKKRRIEEILDHQSNLVRAKTTIKSAWLGIPPVYLIIFIVPTKQHHRSLIHHNSVYSTQPTIPYKQTPLIRFATLPRTNYSRELYLPQLNELFLTNLLHLRHRVPK